MANEEEEEESLPSEQRKYKTEQGDRATVLSSSVQLSGKRNKRIKKPDTQNMSKREIVETKKKNMLENQIYFWFEASVASSFPKIFDWKEDLFCIIPHRSAWNLYPYSYTHSPFCHLYVFLGPSAPPPVCFL
jgi:hypothetical protein